MMGYIIEAKGLSKQFGGFFGIRDVNLKIRRGTIHALIGPNGAGKTTTFNLLTKFLQPTAGTILFDGRDITDMRPSAVARLGMIRSFQISSVFPHFTVRENIRTALQRKLGTSFHFWRSHSSLGELDARIDEIVVSVGLERFMDTVAADLPYGRRRILEFATTLSLDPDVLLLDEPMSGLGREDINRVSDLIRSASGSRTILMVEHNLSVVAALSNTITVMARGSVLTEGTYAEVSTNSDVRAAYMGSTDA